MFALIKQTGKVSHLNIREEKHGEDPVLAVDIKIQFDVGNEFLDSLWPGLRSAFYLADGQQLEGVEPPLSILRFPQLEPLHWGCKVGGALTIHGPRKANDLEFTGDIAKPISLNCKEGGTVVMTVQVQVHPETEQMNALAGTLGRSTRISFVPSEETEEENEEDPEEG